MTATEIPISRTKVILPTLRPEILRRPRLLAHFDDLLERRLVILTAQAGYGKTSLLLDFAHQTELPVCWLSLDALDRDPQRFFSYLIAALQERFPQFGKRSTGVLLTVTSFEQDSERLLSNLINEANDRIKEHFCLVIDDYHFVDFIAPVRDLFSRFISMVGENCHVVISSRRLPALPDIAIMVARQQVSGFDLEELAFRPDEFRLLYEQNYGIRITDAAAEELVHQTEGWITGLHLSAQDAINRISDPAGRGAGLGRVTTARATGVDLDVYLDQQVLSQQTPELRSFLLQTSLLDEFDVRLCEQVLGDGNWRRLLETVRSNNLFILPVGPQGKWLRYHHLFQDFLQARILQETPDTARLIQERLAAVYEQRHEWEKAFALLRQIGDREALVGLVERAGTHLLLGEHLITLQSWLEAIPGLQLQQRPILLSLKGALLCGMGDGRAALTLLDRAVLLHRQADSQAELALTHVRRAAARRILGDYSGAVADADEALCVCRDDPGEEATAAEALRFRGISLFRLGRSGEAFTDLESSLQRYELLNESASITRLHMDLGWACQSAGRYTDATLYYQKALAAWKRENNLYSQASVLNNLAVLYYMQGHYESAVKTLEEGLDCARQGGFSRQEALLLSSLADIYTDLDEYEPALQLCDQALSLAQQVSYQFLVNYVMLVQSRLNRLLGRLQEARSHLKAVQPLVQSSGSNYELGLMHLEKGCLSLVEHRFQAAVRDLASSLDLFTSGGLEAEADWAEVWLAAARVAAADIPAARQHLQHILARFPQEAGDIPLIHLIRHAVPWLDKLKADPDSILLLDRASQAGTRILGLRKRLRRSVRTTPLQISRLTVQALGKPQVRLNGKLVSSSAWQSSSVRDLFFFFLFCSKPVSKEEVGQAFWPDIDPQRLKLRFKNNLYRLRHALGQDVILYQEEGYFFNRHLDYDYDVEEFDAHLAQVSTVQRVEDKIVHLKAAVRLWHAPYLSGVDTIWIWQERQRLERAYLEAMQQLAHLHHQSGNRDSALQVCQRALEVDPTLEDFHCLAMRLHSEAGNRLGVIWQFQACRNALRTELNATPSDITQALYRRLTA